MSDNQNNDHSWKDRIKVVVPAVAIGAAVGAYVTVKLVKPKGDLWLSDDMIHSILEDGKVWFEYEPDWHVVLSDAVNS